MGLIKHEEKIKYRQHATLIQINGSIEDTEIVKHWELDYSDIVRTYGRDRTLVDVLDELSSEGWELICPLVGENGYLLRTVEWLDDTATYYYREGDEGEEGGW